MLTWNQLSKSNLKSMFPRLFLFPVVYEVVTIESLIESRAFSFPAWNDTGRADRRGKYINRPDLVCAVGYKQITNTRRSRVRGEGPFSQEKNTVQVELIIMWTLLGQIKVSMASREHPPLLKKHLDLNICSTSEEKSWCHRNFHFFNF